MSVMARERKKKPDKPRVRSGDPVQAFIDPDIREAMDAYIASYNAGHDHKASVRSTLEGALRKYLEAEGFWPPRPAKP